MMSMERSKNGIFEQSEAEIMEAKKKAENKRRLKGGIIILGVSGVAAAVAGLVTSHISKKSARENLKDLGKHQRLALESPHSLALRALAWGTFWAVGIFSLSIFSLWKFLGLKDLDDLKARVRKHRRQSPEGEGRTEFANLTELLEYLNEESKSKNKTTKTSANDT